MSYRYAQINEEGIVVGDSHLSGIVGVSNMVSIEDNFDLTNKKYVNGEWVKYVPEESTSTTEPVVTQLDKIEANLDFLVMISD